jgi:hypothetical protein
MVATASAESSEATYDVIKANTANTPVINKDGGPVDGVLYWLKKRAAGSEEEGLTQMALDILSCPGEPFVPLSSLFLDREIREGKDQGQGCRELTFIWVARSNFGRRRAHVQFWWGLRCQKAALPLCTLGLPWDGSGVLQQEQHGA